jgi:hypothetical protein
LKAHILKAHSEETKTYDCITCGVRYVAECELKAHIIRRHQSGQDFNYICHFCEEIYNTKRGMRDHIFKKHLRSVYETCNICCGEVVSSARILSNLEMSLI